MYDSYVLIKFLMCVIVRKSKSVNTQPEIALSFLHLKKGLTELLLFCVQLLLIFTEHLIHLHKHS